MSSDEDIEIDLRDRDDDLPGYDPIDLDDEVDDDDADDADVEDALEEDVDFILALYREDGTPVVTALDVELANDLDELIAQLQRLPGDSGALSLTSVAGEFFAAVRVRGQHVHVVLSDVYAAENWSLARDIVDYLGIDIPEEDDEDGLVGDMDIFADLGVSEMDLEAICSDLDEDSDTLALRVADQIHFGPQARKAARSFD